jgi:hypothetical protein
VAVEPASPSGAGVETVVGRVVVAAADSFAARSADATSCRDTPPRALELEMANREKCGPNSLRNRAGRSDAAAMVWTRPRTVFGPCGA